MQHCSCSQCSLVPAVRPVCMQANGLLSSGVAKVATIWPFNGVFTQPLHMKRQGDTSLLLAKVKRLPHEPRKRWTRRWWSPLCWSPGAQCHVPRWKNTGGRTKHKLGSVSQQARNADIINTEHTMPQKSNCCTVGYLEGIFDRLLVKHQRG